MPHLHPRTITTLRRYRAVSLETARVAWRPRGLSRVAHATLALGPDLAPRRAEAYRPRQTRSGSVVDPPIDRRLVGRRTAVDDEARRVRDHPHRQCPDSAARRHVR